MQRKQYTQAGYEKLQQQLNILKGQKRREIAEQIEQARVDGDIRESIDYSDALEQQGMLEARIRFLEQELIDVEIVPTQDIHDRFVAFGCIVEIENLNTEKKHRYQIVGELEADVKAGKLSMEAPLVQALLGKEVGDFIMLDLARGLQEWEILSIHKPKV